MSRGIKVSEETRLAVIALIAEWESSDELAEELADRIFKVLKIY